MATKRIKAKKKLYDSLSVHLRLDVIKRIDRIVDLGKSLNRSEFIRQAILKLLPEKEIGLDEILEEDQDING